MSSDKSSWVSGISEHKKIVLGASLAVGLGLGWLSYTSYIEKFVPYKACLNRSIMGAECSPRCWVWLNSRPGQTFPSTVSPFCKSHPPAIQSTVAISSWHRDGLSSTAVDQVRQAPQEAATHSRLHGASDTNKHFPFPPSFSHSHRRSTVMTTPKPSN